MVLQKLSLEEWFLVYQMDQIKKKCAHLPVTMRVDLSRTFHHFNSRGEKFPINAILMMALGIWAEENPEANKMLFKNRMGHRFLFGDEARINFPIQVRHERKLVTSAIVVRNPHRKTWKEIQSEIKSALKSGLEKLPITKFVVTSRNHFLNRILLRCLYSLAMKSPKLYWKKGGGCISLSSLSNFGSSSGKIFPLAYGPTGFTFCFSALDHLDEKTYLQMGVGIDHNCFAGADAMKLLLRLSEILEAQDDDHFKIFTRTV